MLFISVPINWLLSKFCCLFILRCWFLCSCLFFVCFKLFVFDLRFAFILASCLFVCFLVWFGLLLVVVC